MGNVKTERAVFLVIQLRGLHRSCTGWNKMYLFQFEQNGMFGLFEERLEGHMLIVYNLGKTD